MKRNRNRPWLKKPSAPRTRLYMTDVSHELVGRLENWGRIYRTPREEAPELSPTARFLEQLARSRGQMEAAREFRPDADDRELQEADAFIVLRAWMHPRMPLLPKQVLALHYVRGMLPSRWGRMLGLMRSENETVLVRSHHAIANMLAWIEQNRYKSRDNSTPAAAPARVIVPGANSPARNEKAGHSAGLCRLGHCEECAA